MKVSEVYTKSKKTGKKYYYYRAKVQIDRKTYVRTGKNKKEVRDKILALKEELKKTPKGIDSEKQFSDAVIDYMLHCKAKHTPMWYYTKEKTFSYFADWGELPLKEITKGMIQKALDNLHKDKKKENKDTSANHYLKVLRALFAFAVKMDWIEKNPTKGIEYYPTKQKKEYKPYLYDEFMDLVNAADNFIDKAYLLVHFHAGARDDEVNNLKWTDIQLGDSPQTTKLSKWTKKKSGGYRPCPLPNVNQILYNTLVKLQEITGTEQYVFFPEIPPKEKYGNRRKIDRRKWLKSLAKKAGVSLNGRQPFHAIRHLVGSHLAQQNAPLHYIRDFLGHEDIVTTNRYLARLGIYPSEDFSHLLE